MSKIFCWLYSAMKMNLWEKNSWRWRNWCCSKLRLNLECR